MGKKNCDVFISYSRKRSEEAEKLSNQLDGHSISFFLDKRDISYGKIWTETLAEAIEGCKVCVLMLNEDSNDSKEVQQEINIAYEKQKTIFVVRTERCKPSPKLAYAISGLQHFDAIPPDDKILVVAADEIAKAVREVNQSSNEQSTDSKTERRTVLQRLLSLTKRQWLCILIAVIAVIAFIAIRIGLHSYQRYNNVSPDYNPELLFQKGKLILKFPHKAYMQDFGEDEKHRPPWYSDRDKITSVIIPEEARSISKFAFDDCTNLKTIEIKGNITKIGERAFSECAALESINIPDSVTDIGEYAFYACKSLEKVKMPKNATQIRVHAFEGCSNLKEIQIPPRVTCIDASLFTGCTALEKVEILGDVTKIGASAFDMCKSLPEIHFHDGITEIGDMAFRNCTSLREISGLDSVTKIGDKAFDTCHRLSEISINSVMEIGNAAFNECTALTEINIPDSATKIGENAFSNCTNLSEISLPQTFLQNVGVNAFPYENATFTFRRTYSEMLSEPIPETETSPEPTTNTEIPPEPVTETETSSETATETEIPIEPAA